jgi:membrane-bound metal-dependent hydrolase YbcI (DUF457 family)
MPQNGFHAIIGAAVARRAWPARVSLVVGFLLGSMVPDVDVLLLAILRLQGYWDPGIHRTLTHSVFFAALPLVLAAVTWPRWRSASTFLADLRAGGPVPHRP